MSKVAAIQMCSSSTVEKNLDSASRLIHEAAQNGASLAVLPEMFPIFGNKPTDKLIIKESYKDGPIQEWLSEQAQKNKIWLVGGTIPIATHSEKHIRAASLIYDTNGDIKGRYDKIHLFNAKISNTETYCESDTTHPGEQSLVIDTPIGKLGMAVCFDLRFPELFMELRAKKAEIIAVPAAFTVKTGSAHWKLLIRARAVENFCYVIGAAQGGVHHNHRITYGHSLISDPWGTVLDEQFQPGPGICYAQIDLEKINQTRSMFLEIKEPYLTTYK